MKKYKVGDIVRLRIDSKHYTMNYAGTKVTLLKKDTKMSYLVKGYDGKEFTCPISYFDDDDLFHWNLPELPSKCECGAHKTYGENCPAWYHADFCPLYRPPRK